MRDRGIFESFLTRVENRPKGAVLQVRDKAWSGEELLALAKRFPVAGPEPVPVLTPEADPASFLASILGGLWRGKPAIVSSSEPHVRSKIADDLRKYGASSIPEGVAYVLYTSGSTGHMVGVMVTERSFAVNGEDMRCYVQAHEIDNWAVCSPLSTSYGLTLGVMLPLVYGGSIRPLQYFNPRILLSELSSMNNTMLVASPVVYKGLLGYPKELELIRSSIGACFSSGEPLPLTTAARYDAMGFKIFDCYGSTETNGIAVRSSASHGSFSVLPSAEVRVHMSSREPGDGAILIRGAKLMLGYWGQAELSKMRFQDGWLNTGDRGVVDPDGAFRIVGRRSSMVKVAGHRVYPEHVERELEAMQEVEEALVVPRYLGDDRGETLEAYVKPSSSASAPYPTDLRAALAKVVPPYMVPRRITFVTTIPRVANKKQRSWRPDETEIDTPNEQS